MKLFVQLYLVTSLVFGTQTLSAQTQWQSQTSGTTKDLYGCFFIDAQTGWVVGAGGTILKTNNGGTSWTAVTTTITSALNAVFFYDSNTGWICGDAGKILKTTDGGSTWLPQSLGIVSSGVLKDVFFTSATTGYIAGTFGVYKTTDGGTTWSLSHTSNSNQINVVQFKDAQNGWSAGLNGKIRYTSNGGGSWTQVNTSSNDDYFDLAVTSTSVFLVGLEPEVLCGNNNGSTFTSITAPSDIHGIWFLNDNTGWFCGSSGKLYKSTDAGATWVQSSSGSTKTLKRVFFTSATQGWCVGYSGTILKYQGSEITKLENNSLPPRKVFTDFLKKELVVPFTTADQYCRVTVYSSNGQLIEQRILSANDTQLSYADYPEGMYLCLLQFDNQTTQSVKLIR